MEQQIRLTEQEARRILAYIERRRQRGKPIDARIQKLAEGFEDTLRDLLELDYSRFEDGVAVFDVSWYPFVMEGKKKTESPASKTARL